MSFIKYFNGESFLHRLEWIRNHSISSCVIFVCKHLVHIHTKYPILSSPHGEKTSETAEGVNKIKSNKRALLRALWKQILKIFISFFYWISISKLQTPSYFYVWASSVECHFLSLFVIMRRYTQKKELDKLTFESTFQATLFMLSQQNRSELSSFKFFLQIFGVYLFRMRRKTQLTTEIWKSNKFLINISILYLHVSFYKSPTLLSILRIQVCTYT